MRPRRDGQHDAILTHRSAIRLGRVPVRRRRISLTNPTLPEDVHARTLPSDRTWTKRQRDEPERFPEIVRVQVLSAPQAEQLAAICRALERRLDEHRPD